MKLESISLNSINRTDNKIEYLFTISENLKKYFSGKPFIIVYPFSVSDIPDSILAVPFVCCVLPIIWLTDSTLILDEIDESFYNCIPEVRKGYETMFPESAFRGHIQVGKIVSCDQASEPDNVAMFYSGGLDSAHTFISHYSEKPSLISIWGSDIRYENSDGWQMVHSAIAETSQKYNLPDVVIHSEFREFDNENELDKDYSSQLKDGWWHGVKHGIALLGHVAPYAYKYHISTMYIASSNCPLDGPVRCASNPLTDNQVRYAACSVVHDGFAFSRQDKTQNIVSFCKANQTSFPLHVCWQSQSGGNCCHCEKCFRTIAALISEGACPEDYGFTDVMNQIPFMQKTIVISKSLGVIWRQWPHIQKKFEQNSEEISKTKYWKYTKWILDADFVHPETLHMSLLYRAAMKGRLILNRVSARVRHLFIRN